MNWRLIGIILILPGTALVVVPALILWAASAGGQAVTLASPRQAAFWLGLVFAVVGLTLAVWTVRLFVVEGQGTPAPWDPPRRLVVQGPYRYVRNPMISGALAGLAAEALLFQSWRLAAWMAFFFAVNAVYFPLIEEKGLERRFGDDYHRYKANVPRWIPRLTPWSPDR
ncbi:MAG: methyltransferase family protein [Kiloniellales bacterium]